MARTNRRSFILGLCGTGLISVPGARVTLAATKISPDDKSVLIVVDVQNCFLPGGSLAVTNGDQVIPVINRIAKAFSNVVLTQDWHTPGHISFASAHSGAKPFETIKLPYGDQVLWPDHCVQGTSSADISKDISIPQAELIVRKGYHKDMDSYSAFFEADHKTPTGLGGYLTQRGIDKAFVVGLDDQFQEGCHMGGIHVPFQAPIYAVEGFETKDLAIWRHGGGRLDCRSEIRMWRN